jgi:hypothetical protein
VKTPRNSHGGRGASTPTPTAAITADPATVKAPGPAQHSGVTPYKQVIAHALLLRRSPRALHDDLIVRVCPLCGNPHRHRLFAGATAPVERVALCSRYRTYRVEVVEVLPSQVRAAERGAAA